MNLPHELQRLYDSELQEENVIFVGYLEKKKLMCSAAGVELMIN
jgi:hypothetical protein